MYLRARMLLVVAALFFSVWMTGCVISTTSIYSRPSVNGVHPPGAAPLIIEADNKVLVYVSVTNDRRLQSYYQFFVVPYHEDKQAGGQLESPYYRLRVEDQILVDQAEKTTPPAFIIEVLIASGEGEVFFTPSRVCMFFAKLPTDKICASALLEPGANVPRGDARWWYKEPQDRKPYDGVNRMPLCRGAYERRNSAKELFKDFKPLDSSIVLTSKPSHPLCVALLFDIPVPDPNEPFVIIPGTLVHQKKELTLPKINYELGKYKSGGGIGL